MIRLNRVQSARQYIIDKLEAAGYEVSFEELIRDGEITSIRIDYVYRWVSRIHFTVSMFIDPVELLGKSEERNLEVYVNVFIGHIEDVRKVKEDDH